MRENHQFWFNQKLGRIVISVLVTLMLFVRIGYSQISSTHSQEAILEGSIQVQPNKPVLEDQANKIQPGTSIKITVTVENKGHQTSPVGELYVRYAFAPPLEKEMSSTIFGTEKKFLASIEPGKKIDIVFETTHQLPSLLDFIRYDWLIRDYQAIAVIHQKEYLIGTLALTFSAYYYPGMKKELPTQIVPHTIPGK